MSSVVDTFLEITLYEDDDFLKVRETLTRIGIASRKDKTLYQSCHILQKQGRYYITHFKELFALDGKPTNFSEEDRARRNAIAMLLEDWDLITIVTPLDGDIPRDILNRIKIIPYKEKNQWILEAKYSIGQKKNTTYK